MSKDSNKLIGIIGVLVFIVVIMAYYIGYFTGRLELGAPFIPAGTKATNPATPQKEEEFKQVEEVAYFDLKGDEIAKGKLDSDIVLVEYTDLQCPFCAKFHPNVDSVLEKNKDVKLVTKHFPLSFHQFAKDYAVMFECIAKNSNTEQAYSFVSNLFKVNMDKRGVVTLEDGLNEFKKLGQTDDSFKACKDDSKITQKIQNNFDEGVKLGINGTPAMYILNTSSKKAVRLNGLVDESVIQSEIEKIKK